jgi:hypothetical protein
VAFVVIDSSDEAVLRAETLGFPVVKGDCTADSVLVSAGIRRAAGMAICIGDFTVNLVAAMAGREVNPALHIVARGSESRLEERLLRAGADTVVYPLKLGGQCTSWVATSSTGSSWPSVGCGRRGTGCQKGNRLMYAQVKKVEFFPILQRCRFSLVMLCEPHG